MSKEILAVESGAVICKNKTIETQPKPTGKKQTRFEVQYYFILNMFEWFSGDPEEFPF